MCNNQISHSAEEENSPQGRRCPEMQKPSPQSMIPHCRQLEMANSTETPRKEPGDWSQRSPSTSTHLPRQTWNEPRVLGNCKRVVVRSLSSHLCGRIFHPQNAAFKADSRTSSRTPRPKSLTKFVVFESVFCKFCSTVLSAERLFKGRGRVSDKLQHF